MSGSQHVEVHVDDGCMRVHVDNRDGTPFLSMSDECASIVRAMGALALSLGRERCQLVLGGRVEFSGNAHLAVRVAATGDRS